MTTSSTVPIETDRDEENIVLPVFEEHQFKIDSSYECDMIMKGGITSGIVYPYAVLQIATKYRFRSLGGTSAGAIAAAFAAAAEYARLNGKPDGFLKLKVYCDELPNRLLSLFQPSPELTPAVDSVKSVIAANGIKPLIKTGIKKSLLPLAIGAAVLGIPSFFFQSGCYATLLAIVLGAICGGAFGAYRWASLTFINPLKNAIKQLPEHNFGFCTGLTQPGNNEPALTDWIYHALQDIAFGDPNHPEPLTFGHLQGNDPEKPIIELKVVTTNLSMRRPHTLPRLGVSAGFLPDEWEKLFPKPVMDYLYQGGTNIWKNDAKAWSFPKQNKLPVVIAVRMSLSFPLLFTAVPLMVEDTELNSVVKLLGGTSNKYIKKAHFSDGGISSNFPIHMFDALLPTRPTFAFSLEDLLHDSSKVLSRVILPQSASEGLGVQVKQISTLVDFGGQILNSAKDWQDQLLSEITGQRERIARIFLTNREGGLNLNMPPSVSRLLMLWGYEAGCKFTDGDFDFDEHKWRRLLVLYKHLDKNLEDIENIWGAGFGQWYQQYLSQVKSYQGLDLEDRQQIAQDIEQLIESRKNHAQTRLSNTDDRLPKKAGVLKVAPKY